MKKFKTAMKNQKIQLREYQSSDCAQMADLFYQTVHSVNAKDYTQEQLNAWATGMVNVREWDNSFREHKTIVAVNNGKVIGFGDIDKTGYLDRLYVHKDAQGQGIATAICDVLEHSVNGKRIITHASITAKPFFEKRGYITVKKQQVVRHAVTLINYIMEKELR